MQDPFADGGAPRLADVWAHVHPGVAHQHTSGVHDRVQWPTPHTCDFLSASEDLLPRVRSLTVDEGRQASDHQPVLIELD